MLKLTLAISVHRVYNSPNCSGDGVMVRPRSRIIMFLFYVLACVLMCAALASELPEQLTLTNDSSNDYTLRSSTFLKDIQVVTAPRQDTGSFLTIVSPPPPSWHSLSADPEGGLVQAQSLFILHSVFRT
jgi:hypothetical protein